MWYERLTSQKLKPSGFTLTELMIVVAIVAILAAIAYPAYRDQVQKTRRSDGQVKLMEILQAQERYFTENNIYTADLTDLGYATATNVESDEKFYKISAGTGAAPCDALTRCVELTATAQGAQTADGDLTLNALGQKTPADKW